MSKVGNIRKNDQKIVMNEELIHDGVMNGKFVKELRDECQN